MSEMQFKKEEERALLEKSGGPLGFKRKKSLHPERVKPQGGSMVTQLKKKTMGDDSPETPRSPEA